jgi:DNA-binding protein H-NS
MLYIYHKTILYMYDIEPLSPEVIAANGLKLLKWALWAMGNLVQLASINEDNTLEEQRRREQQEKQQRQQQQRLQQQENPSNSSDHNNSNSNGNSDPQKLTIRVPPATPAASTKEEAPSTPITSPSAKSKANGVNSISRIVGIAAGAKKTQQVRNLAKMVSCRFIEMLIFFLRSPVYNDDVERYIFR